MIGYLLLKCYKKNKITENINTYYFDKEWICPICHTDSYTKINVCSPFECKHIYCYECLKLLCKWNQFPKCPMCESKYKNSWIYKNIETKRYNSHNTYFYFSY